MDRPDQLADPGYAHVSVDKRTARTNTVASQDLSIKGHSIFCIGTGGMKRLREGEEGCGTNSYPGTSCYATYLHLRVLPAVLVVNDANIAVSTQGILRAVSVLFGFVDQTAQ